MAAPHIAENRSHHLGIVHVPVVVFHPLTCSGIDGCVSSNRPDDILTGMLSPYGHSRLIELLLNSDVNSYPLI